MVTSWRDHGEGMIKVRAIIAAVTLIAVLVGVTTTSAPLLSAQGKPPRSGTASGQTKSDAALAHIQQMVTRAPIMCGDFAQQKTLKGLSRPVKSTGRFCAASEGGVLWNTLTPFPSSLRLTRQGIVQSQGDRVTSRLSTREEPTVGIISDLLFSVLAGDFARLQHGFRTEASTQGTSWSATLVPKDEGMRRVIGSIELQGDAFVRGLVMHEASGDRTTITFTNLETGAAALHPDEARAFGLNGRGG